MNGGVHHLPSAARGGSAPKGHPPDSKRRVAHQARTTRRSCSRQFPRPARAGLSHKADCCIAVGCAKQALIPQMPLHWAAQLSCRRAWRCATHAKGIHLARSRQKPDADELHFLPAFPETAYRCGYPVSADAHHRADTLPAMRERDQVTAWTHPMEPMRALTPTATSDENGTTS